METEVTVKMKGKAKQMKLVQPVRYLSSDEPSLLVTRTGKITARTKGTCFIYAWRGQRQNSQDQDNRAVRYHKRFVPPDEGTHCDSERIIVTPLNPE